MIIFVLNEKRLKSMAILSLETSSPDRKNFPDENRTKFKSFKRT
jgi:hypothetical protein